MTSLKTILATAFVLALASAQALQAQEQLPPDEPSDLPTEETSNMTFAIKGGLNGA